MTNPKPKNGKKESTASNVQATMSVNSSLPNSIQDGDKQAALTDFIRNDESVMQAIIDTVVKALVNKLIGNKSYIGIPEMTTYSLTYLVLGLVLLTIEGASALAAETVTYDDTVNGTDTPSTLCQLQSGTCSAIRKCKRGKVWRDLCPMATPHCCIVSSHSRDVHCIRAGGHCAEKRVTDCDGQYWPSMCGRSGKRECCIKDSKPEDGACVQRGGHCGSMDNWKAHGCSGDPAMMLKYCGEKRICCIRHSKEEDKPCLAAGGACQVADFDCWNGDYLDGKCAGAPKRRCCVKKEPFIKPTPSPEEGNCQCPCEDDAAPAAPGPKTMGQQIADEAKSHEGSRMWSKKSPHRVGRGKWKCNIFVAEVVEAVGGKIPHRHWWSWSPIGAGEWGNPKSKLLKGSCWTVVKDPKPGDVASDGSHCGIVTGDKQTTSAAEKKVVTNDWGFRAVQKGKITFWRYTCKCDKDNNTTTTESPAPPSPTTPPPPSPEETTDESATAPPTTPPPPMTTQTIVEETETVAQEVVSAAPPSPSTPPPPYPEETSDESATAPPTTPPPPMP